MAQSDDSTSCPVCYENYEDAGDHIPRILQCFHTLCEKCIGQLLKENVLECPECRTKHCASNKVKSFPQNKYILSNIKKSKNSGSDSEFESCAEHGREISLFCNDNQCKTPVCALCLVKDHKGHDIADLVEVNKDSFANLCSKSTGLINDLQSTMESLMITKEELDKKTDSCVREIKQKKEEYMKIFDDFIDEATRKKHEGKTKLERDIRVITENIEMLENIKDKTKSNRYGDIMNKSFAVQVLVDKFRENPCQQKMSHFPCMLEIQQKIYAAS